MRDRLVNAARHHADKVLIRSHHECLTYGQSIEQANAILRDLLAREIKPGDRVGIFASNGPDYIAALYATWLGGLVPAPFHAAATRSEIDQYIDVVKPKAVLVEASREKILPANGSAVVIRRAAGRLDPLVETQVDPGSPAIIMLTSGSTGRAKGVVLSHVNILTNALLSSATIRLSSDDVVLCCVPFTHAFGQNRGLISPMISRATISYLPDAFRVTASSIADEAAKIGATVIVGTPNILAMLSGARELRSLALRCAISGAAPLSEATKDRFEAAAGVPVISAYGTTETSPVICSSVLGVGQEKGSVGFPLAGVELDIRSDDNRSVDEGNLFVRGHNVMLGYLDEPEATSRVIKDGWFETGDIVRRNGDGSLSILGRANKMIKRSGFRVFPAEVEAAISRHPSVEACSVKVLPNPLSGDDFEAHIVIRAPAQLDVAEIEAFCRQELASHKIPTRICIVDQLDVGASGKVRV